MTSAKREEKDFYETHLKEIGKNGKCIVELMIEKYEWQDY